MKLSQIPRVLWYVVTFVAAVVVIVVGLSLRHRGSEIGEKDVHEQLSIIANDQDQKLRETEYQGIFIVGVTLEDSTKCYTITYAVPGVTEQDFQGIEDMLKEDYANNLASSFAGHRDLLEQMQKYGYKFASRYTDENANEFLFSTITAQEVLDRMPK